MKKILLVFLVLFLMSLTANSGRVEKDDFKGSLLKLKIEADSLNSTIKKYNEKP